MHMHVLSRIFGEPQRPFPLSALGGGEGRGEVGETPKPVWHDDPPCPAAVTPQARAERIAIAMPFPQWLT